MELSPKQQAYELIEKSKKILLVAKEHPDEDLIAAMIALALVLEKINKEIDMVCTGFFPTSLSFLPHYKRIKNEVKASKNFVISLDTSKVKVAQFSYDFDEDGNRLNIFITPEGGEFNSEHLSTKTTGFGYDLIIILGSPDLESLGPLYEKSAGLFYETPIINIDHSSSNEQFGEVNLIDPKATSVSEVLYSIIESFGADLIDENVSTALLAGIVASTRSFQADNTSPQAFSVAASLISFGADQQKVVKSMLKNKTLPYLKLWGRALARLKRDSASKFTWTLLTSQDFKKTNARQEDFQGLENELFLAMPETEIAAILYEADVIIKDEEGKDKIEKETRAIIKVDRKIDIKRFASKLAAEVKGALAILSFKDKTLIEAESEVLEKVKQFQKERLAS